ncbi:conserved hypothetical protein [Histoplasma capsulatum G186AR]|uniref:Uncharacterized protein n=2 Tax=Ajellomyces capsulatus TaxID=5037 RepID=C0NKZ8_AJECG|nr:uncharacterized protein HCBG_03828 [Histoplasma capsulatum G186AR]EEH08539.1 conserved hypothetical protein [Histoplasma capsulatum G186AR]KAG5299149.1 hypothetical protein I7I52_09355 [Histoplasma capsulatum]QSS68231.1 hypothetical protein I7I50_07573 [Histoplasma capsulatum G186AR]
MVQLWTTESSYKECNQSDSDESEENPPKSVSHFFWAAIFIGLIAFGALLIVLAPKNWLRGNSCVFASGSKEVSSSPQQQNDEDLIMDCGKTRAEAVARGCVLDVLGAAWIPPLCYDKELAEESVLSDTELAKVGGSGIFQWWTDYNHTVEISQDRLQYLDDLVGYTWEKFHVAHCLYDWRVLVKAAKRIRKGERNVYVHISLLNYQHAHHCSEVIANQDHRVGARAKVDLALGKCVRLDMY